MADLDFDSDYIWVTDFTPEAAIEFHNQIMKSFKEDRNRPITVYIDSYGGELYSLFSMLDTMDSVRNAAAETGCVNFHIKTVVQGKAMSCGAALLSHGFPRIASPYSTIMIHQSSGGNEGHINDRIIDVEESKRVNNLLLQILKKNCKYAGTLEELKAFMERDVYMGPQQALKFGIVDHIGSIDEMEVKLQKVSLIKFKKGKGK